MFSEEEINKIVSLKIEADEQLGDQVGGSGHLGYANYLLTDVETEEREDGTTEIRYSYKVIVETEFTYFPDNPPMEMFRSKVLVIDKEKNVMG